MTAIDLGDYSAVRERADAEPGARLLAAMYEELHRLYADREGDLDSVPASAEDMAPPHGSFLVVYAGPEPLACGGVKQLADGVGEIKRMFVDPAARGRGIGTLLLRALEDEAARLGYRRLRLDTGPRQSQALAIYRGAGYTEIADYNGNPLAAHWLEKDLPPSATEPKPERPL